MIRVCFIHEAIRAGITNVVEQKVFIERLWRSLKYEEVYLKAYESVKEARRSIRTWMDFYNSERTHQSLDKMTPDEVYFSKFNWNHAA